MMRPIHPPACEILILLPGERRKTNLPLLLFRNWRSKWWRVSCVGDAKTCRANACKHVDFVCGRYQRCVPDPKVRA